MSKNKEILSAFSFDEYVITKSFFEVNLNFKKKSKIDLEFDLSSDFQLSDDRKTALVTLICIVFENSEEMNQPYTIMANIVGKFSLQDILDDEVIENLCKINATAILYPYLRAYISNIVALSGMPSLVLPTVNVQKMLEDQDS